MSHRVPLTWRMAARELGWGDSRAAGRRLERQVLNREREIRRHIATRIGKPGSKHERKRVTLSSLARHLPELRPSKVEALREHFDAFLDGLDSKIDQRINVYDEETVQPLVEELHKNDDIIAEKLQKLAERVGRLAAP